MYKGDIQQTVVQQAPASMGGGTVLDFAADYPGVMVALVVFLLSVAGFFLKRKLSN